MRKSIINVFAMLLVAGVAFVSCSKESSEIESPSKGYKVSIPADKISSKAVADGGTATFKTTENVYVCNTDKGNVIDEGVLHPSANTASTNFEGTLTGDYYEEGNTLKILYNTNASGVADYSSQNGTLAGVVDAGVASVDVTDISGGTITTGTASISNLQSIFKFQFKNGGVGEPLTVKFVRISSAGNHLQWQYDVVNETGSYSPIDVTNAGGLTTVYVALRFDAAPSDPIIFQVVDSDGKVYTGTKNAPDLTGFVNSKFYNSTINVTPHVFSISDTRKVYFAPGNLVKTDNTYAVGSGNETYAFETVPFNTNGGSLGCGGTPTSNSARGYFTWNEIAISDEDPRKFTVNGVSDWVSMTYDDWDYLYFNGGREMNTGVARFYRVDLGHNGSQIGFLIPPDDATSDDVSVLTPGILTQDVNLFAFLSKGFVFLPAAGYYSYGYMGDIWTNVGQEGYYWITTEDVADGYLFHFSSGSQGNDYSETKGYYLSVRLIHD